MFRFSIIRPWLLHLAVIGWVAGFWWCRGRWEHNLWLQWLVLPFFALNADHVWSLWKEWLDVSREGLRKNLWWFGLFSLLEWQFWVTGFRTGVWWGGAGSGKDFVLATVVISSLVLLARDAKAVNWFWRSVAAIGSVGIAASGVIFYSEYGISEERFRLVWRYEPGFNAVTTGLLVGFVLVVMARTQPFKGWRLWALRGTGLFLLGGALAATESRGALLAVVAAACVQVFQRGSEYWKKNRKFALVLDFLPAFLGFLTYWLLAGNAGESSGELVNRGSAGRLEIYQGYLADLGRLDWFVGKGEVPCLPPEVLGWLVHHPHNAYLGQLVGFGLFGLMLLVAILTMAVWKSRHSSGLSLLVFGLTACLFDGGQMLGVLSLARWETLVVVIPLIMVMTTADGESSTCSNTQVKS